MAKILLIEQQVIVREAIRRFLSPRHIVVTSDEWPTAQTILSYEAAIFDTVTLSRLEQNQKEVETMLSHAKMPSLWLYPEGGTRPDPSPGQVSVQKPLDPKRLASALDDLLGVEMKTRDSGQDHRETSSIIELTDVVEEEEDPSAEEPD